jgi:hypothetical protein
MNGRAATLILVPLTIQVIVSLICGHFAAATITGGIAVGAVHPTGALAVINDAMAFFLMSLTFQLVNMAIVSIFFWILSLCQLLGIALAIFHGN